VICFDFAKYQLRSNAGFLSPLQKLIGEAIHPFSLGNFTGIGITLLLRYLAIVFADHRWFSFNSLRACAMPELAQGNNVRCN